MKDDSSYASSSTLSDNAKEAMELSELQLASQLRHGSSASYSDNLSANHKSASQISMPDLLDSTSVHNTPIVQNSVKSMTSFEVDRSNRSSRSSRMAPSSSMQSSAQIPMMVLPDTSEEHSDDTMGTILLADNLYPVPNQRMGRWGRPIAASEPTRPKNDKVNLWLSTTVNSNGRYSTDNLENVTLNSEITEEPSTAQHNQKSKKTPKQKLAEKLRQKKSPATNDDQDYDSDDFEIAEDIPKTDRKATAPPDDTDAFADLSFPLSTEGQQLWTGNRGRMKGIDSYFNDGKRQIDLILPYQPKIASKLPADVQKEAMRRRYRQRFQESLKALGLQLEEESLSQSQDGKTCFVKIHAPWSFLSRTAELQQMQMPFYTVEQLQHNLDALKFYIKTNGKRTLPINDAINMANVLSHNRDSTTDKMLMALNHGQHPFRIEEFAMPDNKFKYISRFDRKRVEMFDNANDDKAGFFTDCQRSRLVFEVIERTTLAKIVITANNKSKKKDEEIKERVTFYQLVEHQVFENPMVIHDSECKYDPDTDPFKDVPIKFLPYRRWLTEFWGSFVYPWRKFQPLDEIWRYFGVRTSLYFAWVGFYTKYLYLPSFVGIICLAYGIYTAATDPISELYCNRNGNWANRITCRLCPSVTCPYDEIGNSCVYAKLSRVFDNEATVVYAVFIALWAIIFLEKWKGRQAFLVAHWQAKKDFSDDVERAQFREKSRLDTQRRAQKWQNASAKYNEKTVDDPDKFPPDQNPWFTKRARLIDPVTGGDNVWPSHLKTHVISSLITVIFFLTMVVGFMAGIVVYRMVSAAIFQQLKNPIIDKISPVMFSSISASVVNALVIYISTLSYTKIAWRLTDFEMHRTDEEFETSYSYKIFVFQFFNYFGSLLYLALLKGKFTNPNPFHQEGLLVDSCPYSGCMPQLCVQLIIIMSGKQILNNFVEIASPIIKNYMRKRKINQVEDDEDNPNRQWEKDFNLNQVTKPYHFNDYLELVIQYGFLVLFAPAFPPAAILALLNNILEIRIDGHKLLTEFRRPIPVQGDTIGAWLPILEILTKLAVVTNAFVIAFTSEFVERNIHAAFSVDNAAETYLAHIFSTFQTSDYQIANATTKQLLRINELTNTTVETCVFRGFFSSYDSKNPYLQTDRWWKTIMIKLVFVMVFEHFIFMIQTLLQAAIPDIPEDIDTRSKKSRFQEKRSIRFLDLEGGNEEFTELRANVAQILLRQEREAQQKAAEPTRRPERGSKAAKSLDLSNIENDTNQNKALDTVYEIDEDPPESIINASSQFMGNPEATTAENQPANSPNSYSGATILAGNPSRKKAGRNSSISGKGKSSRMTALSSKPASRQSSKMPMEPRRSLASESVRSLHEGGDRSYQSSLRSVPSMNEVTLNDVENKLNTQARVSHPPSFRWTYA